MKNAKNIDDVLDILRQNKADMHERFGVLDIAVFGSTARGDRSANSDIDIHVELKKESLEFYNFMDLKFFLEEILDSKVDLGIKDSIRKELKDRILEESIYA
jgi:hypothetical protein